MIKVACVQSNVVFHKPDANAVKAIADLAALKKQGVDLVVFPEAFLTGYCVENYGSAVMIAIGADSAPIERLRRTCDELDIMAVVGFAELEGVLLYNSAAIFEPGKEPR